MMIYMRVNDLEISSIQQKAHKKYPIYHYEPTPIDFLSNHPTDLWISLSSSSASNLKSLSPIAKYAIHELYNHALQLASNTAVWIPESKTTRFLRNTTHHSMEVPNFPISSQSYCLLHNNEDTDAILTWSGTVDSLNCVRSEGIINMSADDVYELLLDSDRVKEFNKASVGRKDIWIMDSNDSEKNVTKVVRGGNQPPLFRKPIEFTALMHGRELKFPNTEQKDKNEMASPGFMIVCRTVRVIEKDLTAPIIVSDSDVLVATNLILRIQDCNDKCLLITANQFQSPLPSLITKKVSLAASAKMINCLRTYCC